MTTEKEDVNMFHAPLIAELINDDIIYRIYENRIYHVIVPPHITIDMNFVNVGYAFIEKHGGGRFYNIYQFSSFSDIEPEIRSWAANENGNRNTHSDALVIASLPQKILVNFYLKFNRPKQPTGVFYSLEKAIAWTIKKIED